MSSPLHRWAPRPSLIVLLGLVGLAGCVRPHVPMCPIDPRDVLVQVTKEREPPALESPFALADAVELMRLHNPELRKARADWHAVQAVANVKTPYPNPNVEAGPLLLGGGDILSSATWGIEAALGWTILLTDVPRLQDDVNAVSANAALVEAASVEREQYLGLRGEYVAVRLQTDLRAARADLADAAIQTKKMADQAIAAGEATALDVSLLTLETAEIQSELLESEEAVAEARGALGTRLGVRAVGADAPTPTEVPPLPEAVPSLEELRQTVIEHHPRLTALRASYLVAEKELRLEVAKRYPPLGFAFTYEYEELNKYGLPLSIEVPLFDRNQPGIAAACGRRAALREQYAAEVNRVLAEVEHARARLLVRVRRLDLRTSMLEPAEKTQELAETVLQQTGTFDMLRYLEVLRATRRARVDHLASRVALYEAWSDLEQACGAPILAFGGV